MPFISRGSAPFNWHSCTVVSLKVPAMVVYDMVMNVLDTRWFPQHNIAGLISGITFIVLFQSGEASTVEGNKHTHTHYVSQILIPSRFESKSCPNNLLMYCKKENKSVQLVLLLVLWVTRSSVYQKILCLGKK